MCILGFLLIHLKFGGRTVTEHSGFESFSLFFIQYSEIRKVKPQGFRIHAGGCKYVYIECYFRFCVLTTV